MSIQRIHRLRPFPNFKLHELPEDERDEAGSIRANIGDLDNRAKSFWAARMLFLNCAERQFIDLPNTLIFREWQLCAARDAVMSVYHFGRILEGIDESLGRCPNLRSKIDAKAKKGARKQFEQQFPSYISLRNALAHSAERSRTAKDSKRHGRISKRKVQINPELEIWVGDGKTLLLHDHIWGTTFSSQWEGEIVRCEINDQSGQWLDDTTDAYWSSFDGIIDPEPEALPTIAVSSEPPPGWG